MKSRLNLGFSCRQLLGNRQNYAMFTAHSSGPTQESSMAVKKKAAKKTAAKKAPVAKKKVATKKKVVAKKSTAKKAPAKKAAAPSKAKAIATKQTKNQILQLSLFLKQLILIQTLRPTYLY